MKSLTQTLIAALLVVVVVILCTDQGFAQEQTTLNLKLLLHVSDSNWGSWLVIPNPGANIWLGVAGPRYELKDKWSLEVMAGVSSKDKVGQLVFDIRASYDASNRIKVWTNGEYWPKSGEFYSYGEINYRLWNSVMFGIEIETMHFVGRKDNVGGGPRVVFILDKFKINIVHQFRIENQNEIWLRFIF